MTEDQKILAHALARVVFVPGIPVKKFARDMAACASMDQAPELTLKQAEYLRTAVIRFRRQTPADVVALAESMGVSSV